LPPPYNRPRIPQSLRPASFPSTPVRLSRPPRTITPSPEPPTSQTPRSPSLEYEELLQLPDPNIQQINQPAMAAAQQSMPGVGHATAPKFSPDQPRELQRFFATIEQHFTRCVIVDVQEKKSYACSYLHIDSAELWEALPEYDALDNWDLFKAVTFKLYPGAEDERKFSIADMDKLVSEQLRTGIYTDKDLGNYYRSFFSITQFLLTKNRLLIAEQSRAFVRGFQPDLWNRIL